MKLLIIISVFCLFSCSNLGVNFRNDYSPIDIQTARDSLVVITTIGKVKLADDKVLEKKKRAVAIPLGNGYILALAHCIIVPANFKVNTPFGQFTMSGTVLSQKTYIGKEKLELIGMKDDICLLRSKKFKNPFPFEFGNSDDIKIGDSVLSIGFSFAKDFNVKAGIISTLESNIDYFRKEKTGVPKHTFMHSTPVNGGDSGSPLFAFKGGIMQIIGLTNAMLKDHGMAFALKSNYVLKTVEQIKNAKI